MKSKKKEFQRSVTRSASKGITESSTKKQKKQKPIIYRGAKNADHLASQMEETIVEEGE
jgi:hypothetical protein